MSIERRLRDLRVAKVDLENARDALLASMDEEAAKDYHYSGRHAAERYPQYKEAFTLLESTRLM
jgi:hypothetical protein